MQSKNKIPKYCLAITTIVAIFLFPSIAFAKEKVTQWKFQSIDTMKFSRDLSKEKIRDRSFDKIIDEQMRQIRETGATHVAIGTPYDEEFYPILRRWVKTARKHDLNVWFRGNWSGWEGWFSYKKITREEHKKKTFDFILKHKELFQDRDVFTSCPECENGGPGDPRITRDIENHRKFLIEEYALTKKAFSQTNKKVASNYSSMNADVARLIMDQNTTKALDGIVVIDHYVTDPKELVKDVEEIAHTSGGRVVLGEIGAPIPDINGRFTEEQQAEWLKTALVALAELDSLHGINYWVNRGGSTELWKKFGQPKKAVSVLTTYYSGKAFSGQVTDIFGDPIPHIRVNDKSSATETDNKGYFYLPYSHKTQEVTFLSPLYVQKTITLPDRKKAINVTLEKSKKRGFSLSELLYFLFTVR